MLKGVMISGRRIVSLATKAFVSANLFADSGIKKAGSHGTHRPAVLMENSPVDVPAVLRDAIIDSSIATAIITCLCHRLH